MYDRSNWFFVCPFYWLFLSLKLLVLIVWTGFPIYLMWSGCSRLNCNNSYLPYKYLKLGDVKSCLNVLVMRLINWGVINFSLVIVFPMNEWLRLIYLWDTSSLSWRCKYKFCFYIGSHDNRGVTLLSLQIVVICLVITYVFKTT